MAELKRAVLLAVLLLGCGSSDQHKAVASGGAGGALAAVGGNLGTGGESTGGGGATGGDAGHGSGGRGSAEAGIGGSAAGRAGFGAAGGSSAGTSSSAGTGGDPGATCSFDLGVPRCLSCCDGAYPSGGASLRSYLEACLCTAALCADQCASSLCAEASPLDAACDTCLQNNDFSGAPCGDQGLACSSDPACSGYLTCIGGCLG